MIAVMAGKQVKIIALQKFIMMRQRKFGVQLLVDLYGSGRIGLLPVLAEIFCSTSSRNVDDIALMKPGSVQIWILRLF